MVAEPRMSRLEGNERTRGQRIRRSSYRRRTIEQDVALVLRQHAVAFA